MDFEQKRKRCRLQWEIQAEGLMVRQWDSGAEREYHIPFENISIHPTLSALGANSKSKSVKPLIWCATIFALLALAALIGWLAQAANDHKISGDSPIVWACVSTFFVYRVFQRKQSWTNGRFVTTAFNSDTSPVFWFFFPGQKEEASLVHFLDKVYESRDAYLRKTVLPRVVEAKASHEVHGLVLTLRREKIMNEAEFNEFKNRFAPQKAKIGF